MGSVLNLSADFRLALPVTSVHVLGEETKFSESLWFTNTGNLILDTVRKSIIKFVSERAFVISLDLGGEAIKLDDILVDVLTFPHEEVVKLVLRISDRVVWTEVSLEFQDELPVVIHP